MHQYTISLPDAQGSWHLEIGRKDQFVLLTLQFPSRQSVSTYCERREISSFLRSSRRHGFPIHRDQ